MRVTEGRLIQLASLATSKARDAAAKAGQTLSSGVEIDRASADPGRWAEGKAAQARAKISEGHGRAIELAKTRLDDADRSFSSMGEMLSRAQELAVQLGNGTWSDRDRADAATEVNALRASFLAMANQQSGDGEFTLGGSAGVIQPFDSAGNYQGSTTARQVILGEREVQTAGVTGDSLTASHGVDVLATLDSLAVALQAGDQTAIHAAIDPLHRAIDQLATARSEVGVRMTTLNHAADARDGLTERLNTTIDRAVNADPVAAATALARAAQTLEAARTAAQKLISLAGV
jgi:flagellar hook-associated protein 3 FlgL